MSDQRPDKPEPPYPGWSAEQPPERPAVPQQQDQGWQRPGEPEQGPQQPGWGAPPPPAPPSSGGQQSWGPPPGTGGPGGQGQGWGPQQQWGWATPTVKPGVIPLRPLGVGEILDGAITAIRRNLGAMLGLSVVVAVLIHLGSLSFIRTIFDTLNELSVLPQDASDNQILRLFGDFARASLAYYGLFWLGSTILTGVLTVVVSRAVLGDYITVADAWRRARPRLLRLLVLVVVYTLIALGPTVVGWFIVVVLAATAGIGGVVVGAFLFAGGLVASAWLAVRYVLAIPILMIETVQPPSGAPVPIKIIGSFKRSSALVRNSWWRVFGICLLILVIAIVVNQAMSFTVSLPANLANPAEGIGFGAILLIALGGVLATAVTAPFVAGSVALLYIDRRIRAEGLDIDLARAAGVAIPGRTDTPPGGAAHGPGSFG